MKYVASIGNVREVVLLGSADLDYWTARMAPAGVRPRSVDGKAEITLGAFRSRWMGISFGEAIVAVSATPAQGTDTEAYYLVQGYSTIRFFAFVERARFKAPYRHARLELQLDDPIGFELDGGEGHRLRARMGPGREPRETLRTDFAGPIHLPGDAGLRYYARIEGERRVFAGDPETDYVELGARPGDGALGCLADSGFRPSAWQIGLDAKHARSKTFRRGEP